MPPTIAPRPEPALLLSEGPSMGARLARPPGFPRVQRPEQWAPLPPPQNKLTAYAGALSPLLPLPGHRPLLHRPYPGAGVHCASSNGAAIKHTPRQQLQRPVLTSTGGRSLSAVSLCRNGHVQHAAEVAAAPVNNRCRALSTSELGPPKPYADPPFAAREVGIPGPNQFNKFSSAAAAGATQCSVRRGRTGCAMLVPACPSSTPHVSRQLLGSGRSASTGCASPLAPAGSSSPRSAADLATASPSFPRPSNFAVPIWMKAPPAGEVPLPPCCFTSQPAKQEPGSNDSCTTSTSKGPPKPVGDAPSCGAPALPPQSVGARLTPSACHPREHRQRVTPRPNHPRNHGPSLNPPTILRRCNQPRRRSAV
eukprot:GHVT01096300.1.p1 GENE.GHVT01096300.1~~GHVT01096300.1.p1  ORF type:complete len:366 (-),score=44.83 GHVT01096300.1:675-1772(-)